MVPLTGCHVFQSDDRALERCHGCGAARSTHGFLASMRSSHDEKTVMGSNPPGREEEALVLKGQPSKPSSRNFTGLMKSEEKGERTSQHW